jgi:Asp-tRNA(Asn)/Glu-tRNA(Gln) amidotransferase A subunit family amidase
MQAVLARINAVNLAVNAYVTVARESALAAARRATRMLRPQCGCYGRVLWQRVQTFMMTRDLLVRPTVAVPPFPVEQH